jgi:L-asparaginase
VSSVKHDRIRLIGMGGTIAFGPAPEGAIPRLDASDLIARLGACAAGVEPLDLTDTSSIALRDQQLLALTRATQESIDSGCGGVVITHGTDTMEETAYFLALTIDRGRSAIVLTGAMRHHGLDGYDGLANLCAALITARAPGLADAGPVVVMSDEIHAARFVTKSHTTSPGAFTSPTGPIGQVAESEAALWLRPLYADFLGPVTAGQLPRVELVTMVVGMGPAALRAVITTHPDGIVIEGFGGGHMPPQLLDCVDQATAQGIPTVVASRCGDGPTLRRTYAVPGTEIDLQARGAVMAGTISARKARLRLAVAIAAGHPVETAFPVH